MQSPFKWNPVKRRIENGDTERCICCDRKIGKTAMYFHFHNGSLWGKGSWIILESEQREADEKFGGGADMGGYPVGSECLKKYLKAYPELKEYGWRIEPK